MKNLRFAAGLLLLITTSLPGQTPILTSSPLPDGQVGVFYSVQLQTSVTFNHFWTVQLVTGQQFPPGLNLSSSTGVISGTPTQSGLYTFTIVLGVGVPGDASLYPKVFQLSITEPLTITTASPLPRGTVGAAYLQTFAGSGGQSPYFWSLPPGASPPPGLTFNPGSATLQGTPTTAGEFSFTVVLTDYFSTSVNKTFSLTVVNPLTITTSGLPAGVIGQTYPSATLLASGGVPPYSWSFAQGTLPPGLSLNPTTGAITGTPTTPGTTNLVARVIDSAQTSATRALSIVVSGPALTITTTTLPNGIAGQSYTGAKLEASGGSPPYTWSIPQGILPAGLTLNTATGDITGTPASAGTSNFTAQVRDAQQAQVSRALSIQVVAGTLTITTTTLPGGTVGLTYSGALAASGGTGPYTWSISQGSLPGGLALNPSTGAIGGTPTTGGTSTFTARVTDSRQDTASRELSITITAPSGPLTVSTDLLPRGTVGEPYSSTLAGSGGTAPYRWALASGSLPSGIGLDSSGLLSGVPEVQGTSTFSVRLTDASGQSVERSLSIEVSLPLQNFRFSTQTLTFQGIQNGDTPPPQILGVLSGTQIREFTLRTDAGTGGSTAPAWLHVPLLRGSTPARMRVEVRTAGLTPGRYTARITVLDGSQILAVDVQLNIVSQAAALEIAPNIVSFAGTAQTLATAEQSIIIRNSGGNGSVNVTLRVPANAPWLTVTPSSGVASPDAPFVAKLRVAPGTLRPSAYMTQLQVQTPAGNSQVTVRMLIRTTGPVLGLEYSALRFTVREGQGTAASQTVNVLNAGEGSLSWNAEVLNARWISLSPAAGISTNVVGTPVGVAVSTAGLARGIHQGLIRFTSGQAPNSPQYLIVLLQILDPAQRPEPEFAPSGVVFSSANLATERVRLSTSSAPTTFQASPQTRDGAAWLQVSPSTGNVSSEQPITLNLSANPAGLAPGVYRGEVDVALGGFPVRSINVTLIVPRVVAASQAVRALAGCTPDRLVITHTALPGSFSVPVAAPIPVAVNVRDNCQDPVGDASVVLKFSNGDPALPLRVANAQRGTYSGVWVPGAVRDSVTIRAEATSPALAASDADLSGGTGAKLSLPVLSPGGIVSAFNPIGGGVLAPGSVIEIYGSDLATTTAQPTSLPLPVEFNGITVLVGDRQAPLFYTSSGQTNVQIPFEAVPGREYAVLYNVNGALAVSNLTLSPVQPALLAFAQRSNGTFVSPTAPAAPGEILLLYLVGLGGTNPPVASGEGSPGAEPFGRVTSDVAVTIGGRPAELFFQGLTPAFVGLYQVNLRVPADLTTGEHDVVVTSDGRDSNVFRLPVQR